MKSQELKDAYYVIRDGSRYDLYDKAERSGNRTNHKYVGSVVYDSKTQSVSFNGKKYLDISSLNDALTDWAKSLPFSVENYNPSLNEKCRISYCLDDYLSSIGFVYDGLEKMTKGSAYSLKSSNPYYPKQEAIELILHIDDDGKGLVALIDGSDEYRAVHSEFNGLEEAIGAINTVIEPIMLCIASQMVKHYSNISETRKKHNIGVLCTVDWRKMESFNEELKPKLIASLEEALKRLKEE